VNAQCTECRYEGAVNFAGVNTFNYLTLAPSASYAEPLTGFRGVATCDMTTNGAGDTVSTGTNCKWPSNMTARNAFRGPGAYNINLAIRKQFAVTERYKLQFSTESTIC